MGLLRDAHGRGRESHGGKNDDSEDGSKAHEVMFLGGGIRRGMLARCGGHGKVGQVRSPLP
jgi:hypothetical protein